MMPIKKASEPSELQQYRLQANASYDALVSSVKTVIREQLVKEQGYLCAYCMSRIAPSADSMKVEHWQCQTQYPAKQLDYNNLLGCCCGNQGQSPQNQHCDTRKGNQPLSFNPSEPSDAPRLKIRYAPDGTISSDDPSFNLEINNILNLNHTRLKENRAAVLKSIRTALSKKHGAASYAALDKLLLRCLASDADGKNMPYCGIAIQYLEKKLRRVGVK